MSEKLCVFCKHILLNTDYCSGAYPDPASFECSKGHWSINEPDHEFPKGFRKKILAAQTCKDYEVDRLA